MWQAVAIVSVAALGAVWGSKHPERPFGDLFDAVGKTVGGWFGKRNKEKSHDDKKEN